MGSGLCPDNGERGVGETFRLSNKIGTLALLSLSLAWNLKLGT